MNVREEDLNEFMQLYKEEFGKEITKGEAEEITHRLITLYTKLLEPLPSEQHKHHAAS